MKVTLFHGDALEKLKELADNSIDACVTDPPYGLAFMGKHWDYDVPSVDIWREVFRVLKPGAHLLSFGGTRTYHRMVVNIEDAGFEIRDQVQWIYGSGFPKSLDVSKAIDKAAGARGHDGHGFNAAGGDLPSNGGSKFRSDHPEYVKPQGITENAKRWSGWGTALKPANEPIVLARKPLEKGLTVAENVLKYGCGALNIDASRIGYQEGEVNFNVVHNGHTYGKHGIYGEAERVKDRQVFKPQGRWPANVLFDEEAAQVLGEPSRFFYVAKASKRERNFGLEGMPVVTYQSGMGGAMPIDDDGKQRDRFQAQAQAQAQAQNHHPTVKPIKLMEYLCRLITPPNGTILDPFMGSGTTGIAAKKIGFSFIGIEREKEYLEIATKRIEAGDTNE